MTTEKPESLQPLGPMQLQEMEAVTRRYQDALRMELTLGSGLGVEYLAARGLAELGVVDTFRLGLVSNPLPEHAYLKDSLAIPYLSKAGEPLTLRFRMLRHSGDGPKFMKLSGDPLRLYNAPAVYARQGRTVHVCEGEMDAIVLERCGLDAVGIPGANIWKPRWRRILQQYDTVYVWGDPDEAGGKFSRAMTQRLANARTVHLERGDVSDTYAQSGREGIMEALHKVVVG